MEIVDKSLNSGHKYLDKKALILFEKKLTEIESNLYQTGVQVKLTFDRWKARDPEELQ